MHQSDENLPTPEQSEGNLPAPKQAEGTSPDSELHWKEFYAELRRLAERFLARERSGHSILPSDLVNEVYLRMTRGIAGELPNWDNRAKFFSVAAKTMQRILVDHARKKRSRKRGGDFRKLPLRDDHVLPPTDPDLVLELDEALAKLNSVDPTATEVIRLHYFCGLSISEVAEVLSMSRSQAYRQWEFARAWLCDALSQ